MPEKRSIRSPDAGAIPRDIGTTLPGDPRLLPLALSLAGLGAAGWLVWGGRGIGSIRWVIILGAAAAGFFPPVARGVSRLTTPAAPPTRSTNARVALIIWIIATIYLVLTTFNQHRDLFPKTHDDCSYVIGMRILARGRLWMPALPLPDFFDSYYLLARPVYSSIYFPGTALLYVPAIWLNLPYWVMPAIASGAVVAMMYRIVAELLDGPAGLLAAVLTISLSWFRVYSVIVTSHVPMLLMGLLLFWAWLRWREKQKLIWALAIGALGGWAAITRPADAIVFATPVGIAILAALARTARDRSGAGRAVATVALIIAGAAPFLALQVVFDLRVTGRPLATPYAHYLELDQPGSNFGFHPYDATAEPASALPQKHEYYDQWVRPYLQKHAPSRFIGIWARTYLPMIVDVTLPCRMFLLIALLGLLSIRDRRTAVLLATLPLFLLIYALNPFFLEHYAILLIPGVVMLTLLGARTAARIAGRWRTQAAAALALLIVAAAGTSFWEINRLITSESTRISDETFVSTYLRIADRDLADYVEAPAVVLFHYPRGGNYFEEPVYNTDVAWPDDAQIIRAHDLGPRRNSEIFSYYAKHQPNRTFYLFDRTQGENFLRRLGKASELARTPGNSQ